MNETIAKTCQPMPVRKYLVCNSLYSLDNVSENSIVFVFCASSKASFARLKVVVASVVRVLIGAKSSNLFSKFFKPVW